MILHMKEHSRVSRFGKFKKGWWKVTKVQIPYKRLYSLNRVSPNHTNATLQTFLFLEANFIQFLFNQIVPILPGLLVERWLIKWWTQLFWMTFLTPEPYEAKEKSCGVENELTLKNTVICLKFCWVEIQWPRKGILIPSVN